MSSSSLIGRKLGQYEVIELLGKGGMATVYIGYQESVGRRVAIKVLPPHPGLDDQFIERFKLEARTIGGLQHPHILPLYDHGNEDNILYLVMAYVEGGTLEDKMREGGMQLRDVERMLRQIASAMDYAHRRGIIHRDIKPGNILIDGEGNALLADFGIVKMTGGGSNLTGTGVVGTPAYMAPEQGQGMALDGRADIYALGVVIFEMLTGHQPFSADTPMQVMLKHITEPVPNLQSLREDLPAGLDTVMQKVLAKDPDDRYQTATDFAEDFTAAIHSRAESVAAARAQVPLGQQPTVPGSPQHTMQESAAPANTTTAPQTIIMRDSTNPLLLMGGFGLIALVIVIVAVLLLNRPDAGPTGPGQVAADVTPTEAETPEDPTPEATQVAVEQAAPTPTPEPIFGELRYNTVSATGDTVNLRLSGLRPAGSGRTYAAWLLNTADSSALALGSVALDAFGDGVLVFTDPERRLLAAHYNAIIITAEETIGPEPAGEVVYSGSIPIEASRSLYSIFIADEQGINGNSLVHGVRVEADFAAQHAGLAARATTVGGMRTHAEHTINILRGETEDYDGDGRGSNPGRGIGVYFFLDLIEQHLNNAVNAPGASIEIQVNAELVRICVLNIRDWSDQVQVLEHELLAAADLPSVEPQAAESMRLTAIMQTGFDQNENGIIEPFEGECGLDQMPQFALQIGSMSLMAGPLDE